MNSDKGVYVMEIAKMEEIKHELLDRMLGMFTKELIPSILRTKEDTGMNLEILTVSYDELGLGEEEVLAEYFFMPVNEEGFEKYIFNTVYTISDELLQGNIDDLFELISYINFMLPYGSFAINTEKTNLIYRLCSSVSANKKQDEIYEEMDYVVGNGVRVIDSFVDMLVKVMKGELPLDEAIDMITPQNNMQS